MSLPGSLVLLAALGAGPTEVVVQQGESLAQVAKRSLGDERAAAELKALNDLKSDEIPPGTALRLPGPARALALSALTAARNAVKQAGSASSQREEASARLKEAEALFQSARYPEAAEAADSAWRLVSASARQNTKFAVEVEPSGRTKVSSRSGQPVRVEGEGVARPVYPGQTVSVAKGEPPRAAEALTAPALLAPADLGRLKLKPSEKGLGPVTLSWQRVAGAIRYEVDVSPSEKAALNRALSLKVDRAEARLPPLPPGKYAWSVRAVGAQGARSDPSERRSFELLVDPLKLEVKGTTWK